MTTEVRFGEQCETTDAVWMIELMPLNLTNYVQLEIANHAIENCAESIKIRERRWVTAACIDKPFGSEIHNPQIYTDDTDYQIL